MFEKMLKLFVVLVIILCLREIEATDVTLEQIPFPKGKKCGVLTGVTIRSHPMADYVFGKIQGFAVDLMDEISEIAGFNYSLYFSPDDSSNNIRPDIRYGTIQNNKITGMLGDVSNGRADFAVADILVTHPREKFLDFTEPFAESGIVVLIHKNYSNSVTSFSNLFGQTAIKYGLIKNSSIHLLFQESDDPTIQAMNRQMVSNPEVIVSNEREGLERVKTSPYAFIIEEPNADHILEQNCGLTYMKDPDHYYARTHAIALPKNSTVLLEKFNSAIRQLSNWGQLEAIMNRYKKKCGFLKGVTVYTREPFAFFSPITGKMTGFAVELMDQIAAIMGINYTLDYQYDGRYGRVINNTVDGMVAEVYRKLADFAIADLTVTEPRKQFIDFTEPFIESDIAILIHKRNANNITSFWDLVRQPHIQYGALRNGAILSLFDQDKSQTIIEMNNKMRANPDWLVTNTWEGIERVNSTRFAFIMYRSFAEYITGKNCDDFTYIVDPVLRFPRNYAIALPKNSEHLSGFNSAINQLKTNGVIDRLKAKYWKTCE